MNTNLPLHSALSPIATLAESLAERPRSEALATDRRFDDPAWHGHPAYRALGEGYLAWAQQLHSTIDALRLPERQPEQWHAAAGLLIDAFAPTNTLWGNPAALRRAFETGGASLAAGAVHALQDLLENQGMPSTVDASGFEVGKNLAATSGQVVHRHEMFELIRYDTACDAVHEQPFLYVPPQINRFYMIDLAPGRSFIEYVVQQGFRPFVMSWRTRKASRRPRPVAKACPALSRAGASWGCGDRVVATSRHNRNGGTSLRAFMPIDTGLGIRRAGQG